MAGAKGDTVSSCDIPLHYILCESCLQFDSLPHTYLIYLLSKRDTTPRGAGGAGSRAC